MLETIYPIWHPFTSDLLQKQLPLIEKGKDAFLFDSNGKAYLDLISSWWVNIHGHANETIARTIYEQALQLEQVIFAEFTHTPAMTLCNKLQELLPKSLCKFFFSDNGSTAVEAALKMAYQYWDNKGENRELFLSFEGGYHGDTFGAMSVGKQSGFHNRFQKLLFEVICIPYPETWDGDNAVIAKEESSLDSLRALLVSAKRISAVIIEPLIQGASGMRICRPSYINKAVEMVRNEGILVIFDEVMTGFYRTGTMFAMDQLEVVPDMLCLAKGITGGFLPLSLTITTDAIHAGCMRFAHGHSYTANPLGCAAAIASLSLFTTATKSKIKTIEDIHREALSELVLCEAILKPRVLGTIAAFDLKEGLSQSFKEHALEAGLLLRPLKNTVYLMPPYVIEKNDMIRSYRLISEILQKMLEKESVSP